MRPEPELGGSSLLKCGIVLYPNAHLHQERGRRMNCGRVEEANHFFPFVDRWYDCTFIHALFEWCDHGQEKGGLEKFHCHVNHFESVSVEEAYTLPWMVKIFEG